jgi:hypothetical protein
MARPLLMKVVLFLMNKHMNNYKHMELKSDSSKQD